MSKNTSGRRKESALSRERIVAEAVALLDENGESGLTFRALADRLATGAGAIYWHIDNKRDLLTAACDAIIASAVDASASKSTPENRVRSIAGRLFDAMDAHPWIGGALAHSGSALPTVRILEALGQQVQALGVPQAKQWSTTSALMSYITGVGGENAAHSQLARERGFDRASLLTEVSQAWAALDAQKFPFTRHICAQLPKHDDRADFLAGIELLLRGIGASDW
ncbi:TetR family transcriptional regulator [Xanthomonas campestris pv. badrii]|uniref:TetR family transcriptional regulator n=1 Tax=Xanthomonas campestris pv. badrii TaxID=149696 RepID=A0A7Z2ZFT5_XANCA|nr:TetR family transcriptional regulator [Xanthomonas campestris]QJD66466.1 TetR family transcriptional regulator [Xanthomonas campestris pv. badrii]